MADIEEQIDGEIARGDMEVVPQKKQEKIKPVYQIVSTDSKIPVAKAHGKLWQSRKKQALSKRTGRDLGRAWDEALSYYRNDQIKDRVSTGGDSDGNEEHARRMTRRFSETENIVFANTSALVPVLYAKNPRAEFTANDKDDEALAGVLEKLIARLMSKKAAPGINLKQKVRKSVVMCTLTNAAYMEIGYTFREQSSDRALEDLARLSQELVKAKTPQDVRAVEGRIEALEQTVDLLRPAGPWAKFRRPHDVLIDPDSIEDDHSDARWLMIRDFISTSYLNARFREQKGDTKVSLYKPTHVVQAGESGENSAEHEINNYSLFDSSEKAGAASFGYGDEQSYQRAQRTECWWVWDKTTRRVMLYADNDWDWPVWVWDDPYHLQGFFPVYKLQFYTDPEEPMSKGEVTYYLDQQDAVNQINSEFKQARQWARRNLFFDKNKVSKDEVEKMIKGDEDVAVGVDVPEGMNLKDFVVAIVPPSMQFVQLFDKKPILEAIDRVSSVQPVMRGVEFKTNTTNQAINTYNSVQQTRTDEKIDAVEDYIGQIAWGITQLCLQYMPAEQVATLIGQSDAKTWKQMSADEIAATVQMNVVGGSTQKQTSESKKQQALQMGQVLGQFVNAAPKPVIMVLLETMRGAFNDVIPDEQWKMIIQQMMQTPDQAQPPAEGGAPPAEGGAAPQGQPQGDPIAAIEAVVDALPPEAKQALGMAMARGVPVREALTRIAQVAQQQPQQQSA
jgi:hypothetical protein